MQDPVAATATNTSAVAPAAAAGSQQLSHTPPSYEASHSSKRRRGGVSALLSDRLKASTELEEKGVINRDQKGILKDLIISGQDNELQHALDRYEQGDSTVLEGMLQTGTLSNKAAQEIDLLGDLNFDFLNVKEKAAAIAARSRANSLASQPAGGNLSVASDGIGDLDFDGGIGNWEQQGGNRSRSNSTWSQLEYVLSQQRSRANSTASIDLDNNRQRSNSLFSSLLGGDQQQDPQANYGRWMDPSGGGAAATAAPGQSSQQQQLLQQQKHHEQHFQQLLLQQQQQRQREEQAGQFDEDEEEYDDDEEEEEEEATPRKKSGRRSSAS
ncbi:MAG: hypothetical protein SGARI_004677, partial [Bacillariaceae sp.]